MGNHHDLHVWQRSHALAASLDIESRRFGKGNSELADQLRRATISIPTNLAEGSNRMRDGEFARYINIAIGSAAEADSLLLHAARVGALSGGRYDELATELTIVRKMLFKLRTAIERRAAVREPAPEPTAQSREPIRSETS
jgi:four helix bundle protein